MSDTDLRPVTDADIETPPADSPLELAEPLKTEGVAIEAEPEPTGATAQAKQAIRDGGGKLATQATDKARAFADQGKAKAGDALDQVSQMLLDAARQVDDKLGPQYGHYARTASEQVTSFSESIKAKDVDELVEDVRAFVRASPAIAIGIAATAGFALSRVIQAGIEADTGDAKG